MRVKALIFGSRRGSRRPVRGPLKMAPGWAERFASGQAAPAARPQPVTRKTPSA